MGWTLDSVLRFVFDKRGDLRCLETAVGRRKKQIKSLARSEDQNEEDALYLSLLRDAK